MHLHHRRKRRVRLTGRHRNVALPRAQVKFAFRTFVGAAAKAPPARDGGPDAAVAAAAASIVAKVKER